MRYGSIEFAHAEPIANALVSDQDFRAWLLGQTKFEKFANDAKVLHEEMQAIRKAQTWWRSHYTEKCRCAGCRGQETDLLAIFGTSGVSRFALHLEIKQPTDSFPTKSDQAGNHRLRAMCWAKKPPSAVLPHTDYATGLICCSSKLAKYAPNLHGFDTIFTFEEIYRRILYAAPKGAKGLQAKAAGIT